MPPVPKQTSVWDARRNSSQVFPVAHDALPSALRAMMHLRATQPALVRWLEDGHPTLTDAEHVARFGEPYRGIRAPKREAASAARERGR